MLFGIGARKSEQTVWRCKKQFLCSSIPNSSDLVPQNGDTHNNENRNFSTVCATMLLYFFYGLEYLNYFATSIVWNKHMSYVWFLSTLAITPPMRLSKFYNTLFTKEGLFKYTNKTWLKHTHIKTFCQRVTLSEPE